MSTPGYSIDYLIGYPGGPQAGLYCRIAHAIEDRT